MKQLKVIAFTHKKVDLKDLGTLIIDNDDLDHRLLLLKESFDIPEIFYLGTCNRVEFVFYGEHELNPGFLTAFLNMLDTGVPADRMENFVGGVDTYEGVDALRHLSACPARWKAWSWAKKKFLPRSVGPMSGVKAVGLQAISCV